MSRQKPSHIPEKLPPCDGPKLEQFKYHKSPIEWRERLDAHRDNDDATEGYVFRAIINRREYAIKVFKFFNPRSTEPFWGPVVGRDTPLDTAAYYSDPFFSECRAYGRINEAVKQRKLRSDVAIPCHGFLFLQKRDEAALDRYDLDFNLDNVDLDYQNSTVAGCRLRAIVKDIASSDPGVGTHFGAARPRDQRNPSRDPNVHIFPPSLTRRSVRILLAPFITLLLLAPVVLCNLIDSLTARLAIVVFE